MAHIDLQNVLPGIRGLMAYSPETADALNHLAEILLHADNNSLTRGEREMIATYVSAKNDCFFCQNVHGAMAQHYFGSSMEFIDSIKNDYSNTSISPKLKALLGIAGCVQQGGKFVQPETIERARNEGATDKEIHDTVLIAAAFCMFNRYVDGLDTWAPRDRNFYIDRAAMRAEEGYAGIDVRK